VAAVAGAGAEGWGRWKQVTGSDMSNSSTQLWTGEASVASTDKGEQKQSTLGTVGTPRHFFFYVIVAALLGSLITLGISRVFTWHTSYDEQELSKQIEGILTKQTIPTLAKTIGETIEAKFIQLRRDDIAPMRTDIGNLQTDLNRLQGDVKNLENGLPVREYKAQAQRLGIKDPQIVRVDWRPRATFDATYPIAPNNAIRVRYSIEQISADGAVVFVAEISQIFQGKEIKIMAPVRQEIPRDIAGVRLLTDIKDASGKVVSAPPILVAILRRNPPDNLILATGPSAKG
jgi:hypothetical protein